MLRVNGRKREGRGAVRRDKRRIIAHAKDTVLSSEYLIGADLIIHATVDIVMAPVVVLREFRRDKLRHVNLL